MRLSIKSVNKNRVKCTEGVINRVKAESEIEITLKASLYSQNETPISMSDLFIFQAHEAVRVIKMTIDLKSERSLT